MKLMEWLLEGDPVVLYQVNRDLLDRKAPSIQERMLSEGIIKEYYARRDPETKMWGGGIYSPKWISTHYTLLDLKNFNSPVTKEYLESANLLLEKMWFNKGLVRKNRYQDMCVVGMILSILCYGNIHDERMQEMVDYILNNIKKDGGFNCSATSEVSSVHTTLTMLEFIRDYEMYGYTYRLDELKAVEKTSQNYLLVRELYKRRRDGEPIKNRLFYMPLPVRYQYDVIRALDYFQSIRYPYDERLEFALQWLIGKQKDGRYKTTGNYPGKIHFKIEDDSFSRLNTVRALRIIRWFKPKVYQEMMED